MSRLVTALGSTYYAAIVVIFATTAAIALLAGFLQDAQQQVLFLGVLGVEAVADVASTLYLAHLVRADPSQPRSWLLIVLTITSACVTTGYVGFGALIALRVAGVILPIGLGQNLTGTLLVIVGSSPILKAATFFLAQRDTDIQPGIPADVRGLSAALCEDNVKALLAADDVPHAAKAIMLALQRYATAPREA